MHYPIKLLSNNQSILINSIFFTNFNLNKMKHTFQTIILILVSVNLFGQQSNSNCPSDELQRIFNNPTDRILMADPGGPINPTLSGGDGQAAPEDRMIFWMHGVGGNSNSWTRAATASEEGAPGFAARKIQSIRMDYSNEIYNIEGAGNKMKNDIRQLTKLDDPDKKRLNYIIAHSQGGIVSRQMDKFFDNPNDEMDRGYGGIVTFNTPHSGAQLVNNIEGDVLKEITDETCDALASGPIAEKIDTIRDLSNIKFLGGIIKFNVIDNINNKFPIKEFLVSEFCEFMSDVLPPYVMSQVIQSNGITNDYAVGAPKMIELANHNNPDVHKIAFWTSGNGSKFNVLNDYLIWRTVHYLINSPNAEEYFDAHQEQEAVDTAQANAGKYFGKAMYWSTLSQNSYEACTYFMKKYIKTNNLIYKKLATKEFFKYINYKEIADSYAEGVEWWTTINDKYKVLIGALKVENVNGNIIKTQFDSDGVVLTSSQKAFPGAITVNPGPGIPTTHMQARNNTTTKNGLEDLYSGSINKFFFTKTK